MKILVLILLSIGANAAFAADACQAQIPASLQAALGKAFPQFRSPRVTDNDTDAIEYNKEQGGTGCVGVASADFDGDGTTDFLLGLTATKGDGALVVVALARGKSWRLKVLERWPRERSRLYVAAGKPGSYHRTAALENPLSPGEVDPLHCPHAAAVFGAAESTGIAWCLSGGSWRHVWIDD